MAANRARGLRQQVVVGIILIYDSFRWPVVSVLEPLMIVCVCRRVSDRDIERHVRNGCASFDELQMDSGVASCCGRCTDAARESFASATSKQAGPHTHFLPARIPLAA
jgi:bacterioferritin-associated ferredoxin